MSFFTSRTGKEITGSEENSFTSNFRSLPDNTQAVAMIKSFKENEYLGDKFYQIIWKLLDGDFANSEVKQSIRVFDADDYKAQTALNMMFRIFKLCNHTKEYTNPPTNEDLAELRGCILSIKIGNGIIGDRDTTWVREVWKEGEIETCTGETKIVTSAPSQTSHDREPMDSALSRNAQAKQSAPDDDIPF
jgi:hypothetical protein